MRDPVGTALASIGAGATTGAVVLTAGVVTLRTMQAGRVPDASQAIGFAVFATSVLAGIIAAVSAGWLRSRRIGDFWRRGVIAALSVFGASLLALIAAPVDVAAGLSGLVAYLTVMVVAALLAHRAARRAASQ